MNLASALLKQIISLQDYETWSSVREHYLPREYSRLFKKIEAHTEKYHKLPTFEDLELDIRDNKTRDFLFAIKAVDIEIEPYILLEYVKNEYTQKEILEQLEKYVEESICYEDAEESVQHLHQIVMNVEDKVELDDPQESMQRMPLFETDEELSKYLALGINAEYDYEMKHSPIDLILIGGKRGQGKSLTCANVANNVYEQGKSAVIFTIEMDSRSTMQRSCAIGANVPFARLRTKNLGVIEWERVATWWADRYIDGDVQLQKYKEHRCFDTFHAELTSKCQLDPVRQIDIIYDPGLTISKIRAEMDKRVAGQQDIGVIIVDYLNQVRRSMLPSRGGLYDWTEQIEVSKALKRMAQEYKIPVLSPYQVDATGEARFAKGILDAADAAYTIESHDPESECITFNSVKQRNASIKSFTSVMDWETLRMGPASAPYPSDVKDESVKTGEDIDDIQV